MSENITTVNEVNLEVEGFYAFVPDPNLPGYQEGWDEHTRKVYAWLQKHPIPEHIILGQLDKIKPH